jgi:hypothetical protein
LMPRANFVVGSRERSPVAELRCAITTPIAAEIRIWSG